jgi:hypothetical protein
MCWCLARKKPHRNPGKLSPTDNAVLSGALGGALIGAAGALLALLVVDWRQTVAARQLRAEKLDSTCKLIAAELVNVALGLIQTKRTMDVAIETYHNNDVVPENENFERDRPREMPLTDSLGADLLILPSSSLDALATLKANLARTADSLAEISSGRQRFGLLAAQRLSGGLAHDMTVLAKCFDCFAPERKLEFSNRPKAELATELLREFSRKSIANERL